MVRSPDEIISYLSSVIGECPDCESVPSTLPEQAAFFERFCKEVPVDLAKEARMSALVFASSPQRLGEMCGLVRKAYKICRGFVGFLDSPLHESVVNAVRDREHLRENLSRVVPGHLTSEGAKAVLSGATRLLIALEQNDEPVHGALAEIASLLQRVAEGVSEEDAALIRCLFLG